MKYRDDIVPVSGDNDDIMYNLFNTGDIILNRGTYQVWNHPMYYYALYCSISRTIFTHIGVIVKDHVKKKLYILHVAPRFRGVYDFLGSHPQPHAFLLHDLRQYINKYNGTTLIRRRQQGSLIYPVNSIELTKIAVKMQKEYKNEGYRFTRLNTLILRYLDMYNGNCPKEVHCAEFAGLVLQKMGLIDQSIKCWDIYPDTFSIEKNKELLGYEEKYFHIKI
jgi:hypothetical protein